MARVGSMSAAPILSTVSKSSEATNSAPLPMSASVITSGPNHCAYRIPRGSRPLAPTPKPVTFEQPLGVPVGKV